MKYNLAKKWSEWQLWVHYALLVIDLFILVWAMQFIFFVNYGTIMYKFVYYFIGLSLGDQLNHYILFTFAGWRD